MEMKTGPTVLSYKQLKLFFNLITIVFISSSFLISNLIETQDLTFKIKIQNKHNLSLLLRKHNTLKS